MIFIFILSREAPEGDGGEIRVTSLGTLLRADEGDFRTQIYADNHLELSGVSGKVIEIYIHEFLSAAIKLICLIYCGNRTRLFEEMFVDSSKND